MNYSIIGSGNVGTALARQFARSGIVVGIANTRGPASVAALAQELGEHVKPMSLQEAVKADVVILAVPFSAHAAVAGSVRDWAGKVVVDAMNTYGIRVEELKGRPSTDVVSDAFPGARIVKTFNQLPARLLAANPVESGGRRVMFLASNDEVAAASVGQLVANLGFAPVQLGRVDEGGVLIGLGGPLLLQNLTKQG